MFAGCSTCSCTSYQGGLASHGDPKMILKEKVTAQVLCRQTQVTPQANFSRKSHDQCSWCPQGLGYHESLYNANSVNYHSSTLSYCTLLENFNFTGNLTTDTLQESGSIRGKEDAFIKLQQIWECVSIQTLWRLEECLVYIGNSHQSRLLEPYLTNLPHVHPSTVTPPNPLPTTEQSVNTSTNEPDNLFFRVSAPISILPPSSWTSW